MWREHRRIVVSPNGGVQSHGGTQNEWFIGENQNPMNMDDLGYPQVWNPPFGDEQHTQPSHLPTLAETDQRHDGLAAWFSQAVTEVLVLTKHAVMLRCY